MLRFLVLVPGRFQINRRFIKSWLFRHLKTTLDYAAKDDTDFAFKVVSEAGMRMKHSPFLV
jgi:hypothetical protein